MNWRELLSIDVASLFRGDEPPRVAPTMFRRLRREHRDVEPPELELRVDRDSWLGPWYLNRGKWRRELLLVTEQLAAIIRSNSPLTGGLYAAALDAFSISLQDVFLVLREDIASGLSLTQAMLRRPRFFPPFYVDLVRAGEDTGRLYDTFSGLADDLLQNVSFRNVLRSYAAYVGVVVVTQCAIVAFLWAKIMPVFIEIVEDFGAEMPHSTRVFMAAGDYLGTGGWITIAVVVSLLTIAGKLLCRLLQRRERLRQASASLLIGIPFLRGLVVKFNLAHASLVLEKLLAGGVPLDVALEDAELLDISPMYQATMRRLRESVQSGETLNAAMENEPLLPESFRGLISIGESSGLLPEAFGRIAQLYRREAMKTGKIFMDVTAPVGVLALGGLTLSVGLSFFAMMVAMYEVLMNAV